MGTTAYNASASPGAPSSQYIDLLLIDTPTTHSHPRKIHAGTICNATHPAPLPTFKHIQVAYNPTLVHYLLLTNARCPPEGCPSMFHLPALSSTRETLLHDTRAQQGITSGPPDDNTLPLLGKASIVPSSIGASSGSQIMRHIGSTPSLCTQTPLQ